MHVENGLPRVGAAVYDGTVAAGDESFLARDRRGGEHQLAEHGRARGVVECCDVFARYDEYVRRRLGVDIAERDHVFILQHQRRRNFLSHDAAEQAAL